MNARIFRWCWSWMMILTVLIVTASCAGHSRVKTAPTSQAVTDFRVIEQSEQRTLTASEQDQIKAAVDRYLASVEPGRSGTYRVRVNFAPEQAGASGEWVVVQITTRVVESYALMDVSYATGFSRRYDYDFDRYGYGWWGANYSDPFYFNPGFSTPPRAGYRYRPPEVQPDPLDHHPRGPLPRVDEPPLSRPRHPWVRTNAGTPVVPRRDFKPDPLPEVPAPAPRVNPPDQDRNPNGEGRGSSWGRGRTGVREVPVTRPEPPPAPAAPTHSERTTSRTSDASSPAPSPAQVERPTSRGSAWRNRE